jgi:carbon-monoxide dehydrogenase large subunit
MNAKPGFVGRPIERIEDLRLLRGRGQYVDDIHQAGMLHAVFLRSTVPHARILRVDVAAARTMPGVHAVYVAADVAQTADERVPTVPLRLAPQPDLVRFEQPVMAHDKIRYVGEIVAMVVADTIALAEDAAEAIELYLEPLPVVADRRAAGTADALLFEAEGTNCAITYTVTKGDVARVSASYTRRERFAVQRHAAMTMEPRGVVALWDGARTKLTVLGAAKVPFANRKILAQRMDLPDECIDMIELDVGGGFGQRGEFHAEDYLVPFAARKLDRPVKWIEDRREHLLSANHSREMDCELKIACDRDGTVLALSGHIWVDAGAFMRNNGTIPPRNVAQFLSGPYRIAHLHVQSSAMLTNKAPIGTYRGPGRFEADFFRERLFDMAAKDLGIDPVEFRRRNLARHDEMPYALGTIDRPEKKESLDSGDYRITLERCLAEFKWQERRRCRASSSTAAITAWGLAVSSKAAPRDRAKARASASSPMARSRSMSARPASGRDSRRCACRSRPMRWACRWSAFRSFTARPLM